MADEPDNQWQLGGQWQLGSNQAGVSADASMQFWLAYERETQVGLLFADGQSAGLALPLYKKSFFAVGVAPRCNDKNGKIGRKTPKPVMPISTTLASANIDPVREPIRAD